MKKICIYGKGGIGKSTVVSNLAAAMADQGLKVAVVGCDPKADSTRNLTGCRIPTILDIRHHRDSMTDFGNDHKKLEWVHGIGAFGYGRVLCMESGGPSPGTGCAGRGIVAALDAIHAKGLLEGMDVVLYDVLGDVVCGGFSAPLRAGAADQVYLITTSDCMALYAANNICRGIEKFAGDRGVGLAGIILNHRSVLNRTALVNEFARKIGTRVVGHLPLSPLISRAEIKRSTVIQAFPDDPLAEHLRALAASVYDNSARVIPTPLSWQELERMEQNGRMELTQSNSERMYTNADHEG